MTFKEAFKKSDKVTANHTLFAQYKEHYQVNNKLQFYISMIDAFGNCNGKDENNNLGYHLTLINPLNGADSA